MSARLSDDEVLTRVRSLPALPQIVHELRHAVLEDSVSTERIVRLVGSDHALTATALKLANSSFYGVGGRVLSLRDAVHILGIQTLSSAVTTAAAMACFDPGACPGFDFGGCWRHALATAMCAQLLAEPRGIDACAAYTVGLLHDLGTLALATYFPAPFATTLARSAALDMPSIAAEREWLGTDHAAVGALLAAHWRFSPSLIDAIRLHHEVPAANGNVLIDVLHLADNIAHALDLSHAMDDMVPPLSLESWERVAPGSAELQHAFGCMEARVLSADFGPRR